MKRVKSKATLIKKRVRKVQGRAKFAGFLYFLGTIALCVAGFAVVFMKDTFLSTENGLLPVMKFYSELMSLIKDNGFKGILGSSALLVKALALVIYAGMLIALVINLLRAFGKLGWLFKRRASYANGFNRNAYAMDDLSKRFSGSLTSLIVCNLLVYLLTTTSEISILSFTLYGYATLGAGLALHFICGLIEGNVTLFTTGEKVEEEERDVTLEDLNDLNIDGYSISKNVSEEKAIIVVDVYTFEIDKDLQISDR
jgi:hypothetical protein